MAATTFDIPDDDPEYQELLTRYGVGGASPDAKQNTGFGGDTATGLKRGVQMLPGIATGLADIAATPFSAVTGVKRPFSRMADAAGEFTGFQPGKWAEEAESEYSPQYRAAAAKVDEVQGFFPTLGAALQNPRYAANAVVESIPGMLAGGVAGRVAMGAMAGAEGLAALRAGAAAGDAAAKAQLLRYGAAAGGIGEGAVSAGQQMAQTDYDVDPLRAGATTLAAGVGTGLIGAAGGRLAAKMGVTDVDTALAAGTLGRTAGEGTGSVLKQAAKTAALGAFQEGVLEEMPQSMQEQIWQNVADGKPWDEGVGKAGAIGLVAGGLMGAGVNAFAGSKPEKPPQLQPEEKPADLLQLGYDPKVGTSWNNTYNHNPIIAEGSESQVPLQQLDLLHGRRDATASNEAANTDLSIQRQDTLYGTPSFDLNDQTLPLPVDPGSAVAVLQVLSHAQQNGQALVEGTPAHSALVEAQRILTENGLSYLASKVAPPVAQTAKAAQAITASKAKSVAPATPVAPAAPKEIKPAGKEAIKFESELSAALAEDPQNEVVQTIAEQWGESKKTNTKAKELRKSLSTAGTNVTVETSEAKLQREAAMTDEEKFAAGWTKATVKGAEKWVAPKSKQSAKGARTTDAEQVAPEDVEDPTVAEGIRMFQAGDSLRTIADNLGGSHTQWGNVLAQYGHTVAERDAATAQEALDTNASAATVDNPEAAIAEGESVETPDAAPSDYTNNDEVVDQEAEQGGVTIRSRMDAGGVTEATTDKAAIAEMRRKWDAAPSGMKARITSQLTDLRVNPGMLTPAARAAYLDIVQKEGRSLTAEDVARGNALDEAMKPKATGSKLAVARQEQKDANELAEQSDAVKTGVESLLSGDTAAAVDLMELLGGKNGLRLMQLLRTNLGMPKSVTTPKGAVEYFVGKSADTKTEREAMLPEAAKVWGEGFEALPEKAQMDFLRSMIGLGDMINTPAVLRQVKGDIQSEYVRGQVGENAEGISGRGEERPDDRRDDAGSGTSGTDQGRAPEVKVRKKRTVVREEVESKPKFSVGGQGANDIRGSLPGADAGSRGGKEGAAENSTADGVRNKLKKLFFSGERFDKLVRIVQSKSDLAQHGIDLAAVPDSAHGFVQGGKVYLIAGNIPRGQELAKFLHEVGVHLGMEKLIGRGNVEYLATQIKRWANATGTGTHIELAKKALARVANAESVLGEQGQKMDDVETMEELVAYFVEEAVQAGISPAAVSKASGPLGKWFRTLWAAAKLAMRKIGMYNFDQLTPQNFVDLAYGAARMELEGTWHGTAADFRNFNHGYMGSGEGAQAFGWGTYLAQAVGIAKGYWRDDINRKTTGGAFRSASGFPITEGELQRDLNGMVQAGRDLDDAALATLLRNYKETLAKWEGRAEFKRDYDRLQYSLTELEDAISDGGITYQPRTQPDGALMRVDAAVHDTELLDWDKPVSGKVLDNVAMYTPAELQEALSEKQNMDLNEMTGKDLYFGLKALELREGSVGELMDDATVNAAYARNKKDSTAAMEVVSKYLDSIGIPGIKFLDSNSRNMKDVAVLEKRLAAVKEDLANLEARGPTNQMWYNDVAKLELEVKFREGELAAAKKQGERTNNLVIFDDKNIQRVSSQVGARKDSGSIKFSIGAGSTRAEEVNQLGKQLKEYLRGKFQTVDNALRFGHSLAEKAANMIPGAAKYFTAMRRRQVERVKHEQQVAEIAEAHYQLPEAEQEKVNLFIEKSTTGGKWGYDVEIDGYKFVADPAIAKDFAKLSKEAQQVVRRVFTHGVEQQKRFDEAVNANIEDPKDHVKRNEMFGKPYAPLKRFGDHVVIGKSEAYVAEQKRIKDNGGGTSDLLESMKEDPDHYFVEFTNGDWEAIGRKNELAKKNPKMSWEKKPLQNEDSKLGSLNFTMLKKLEAQIKGSTEFSKRQKSALASVANQMYMAQLNRTHANKSQMQRRKVAGYDTDMMRAFVSQGKSEAALIAQLMTHAESEGALQAIKTAAKEGEGQDAKTRLANEVMRRHLAMMNYADTPVQDFLMKTNSVMFLLTSPAYYLINTTQPFMVSLPYMVSKFGTGASSTFMGAYKEALKFTKLFSDNKLDLAHLRKFDSVGKESDALKVLLDENLVNIGMEMELGSIVQGGSNRLTKTANNAISKLRMVVSNTETLNRLSTAVAAYRMAYTEAAKGGNSAEQAHEAGTKYAREVVTNTHGDYSGYNAPSVMMQGAYGNLPVKLISQFKKYSFIQFGLMAGALRTAFAGSTQEEKAAARAMLRWLIGTQAVMAGGFGIPLVGGLASVLGALLGGDGEDKEEYLRRILGGGDFAKLILRGVPAAAGVDISKRVGTAGIVDPFGLFNGYGDWKDKALSVTMGPTAGVASRMVQGATYMKQGQYWKGMENFVPNGLANASKAFRFADEGISNSKGDIVMQPEDISFLAEVSQAVGLPSTTITDRQWKAGVVADREMYFKERASEIKRDFVEARKAGESTGPITQEWVKLQASRVEQGFKRQPMSDLYNAVKANQRRERDVIGGVQFNKGNKGYVSSLADL